MHSCLIDLGNSKEVVISTLCDNYPYTSILLGSIIITVAYVLLRRNKVATSVILLSLGMNIFAPFYGDIITVIRDCVLSDFFPYIDAAKRYNFWSVMCYLTYPLKALFFYLGASSLLILLMKIIFNIALLSLYWKIGLRIGIPIEILFTLALFENYILELHPRFIAGFLLPLITLSVLSEGNIFAFFLLSTAGFVLHPIYSFSLMLISMDIILFKNEKKGLYLLLYSIVLVIASLLSTPEFAALINYMVYGILFGNMPFEKITYEIPLMDLKGKILFFSQLIFTLPILYIFVKRYLKKGKRGKLGIVLYFLIMMASLKRGILASYMLPLYGISIANIVRKDDLRNFIIRRNISYILFFNGLIFYIGYVGIGYVIRTCTPSGINYIIGISPDVTMSELYYLYSFPYAPVAYPLTSWSYILMYTTFKQLNKIVWTSSQGVKYKASVWPAIRTALLCYSLPRLCVTIQEPYANVLAYISPSKSIFIPIVENTIFDEYRIYALCSITKG